MDYLSNTNCIPPTDFTIPFSSSIVNKEALFLETNPGPLKWAMGRLGHIAPTLRLPLCEPSVENQARIEAVLNDYGLLSQKEIP